jgi:hypothetical protein
VVDTKIQVIVDQNGNFITAFKPQSIKLPNGETINTLIRPGLPVLLLVTTLTYSNQTIIYHLYTHTYSYRQMSLK